MSKFKDALGREWELRITLGSAKAVERHANVKLLSILEGGALPDLLFTNPARLANVLWVLVQAQAQSDKVDVDSFEDGFDGEAMERASVAMLEAVTDFFHRSKVARAIKGKIPEIVGQAEDQMIAHIGGLGSSSGAGSTPELPASTPSHEV